MRRFVLSVFLLITGGCASQPGALVLELELEVPVRVAMSATSPDAFVDRTYEPWFVFTSPGLGDNPAAPSSTRLSLTVSQPYAVIDNSASAALLFRAPGFHDCDLFSGFISDDERDDGWTVSIDAECLSAPTYHVRGTLTGN